MKQKIGTVLDPETARRLKERSLQEGRPMSNIIAEALSTYLNGGVRTELRIAAVERICSRPFRLTVRQMLNLSAEDYYDQ